ncbi:CCA tRNA nucleotidyltransferase [Sanguibacter antarcticus]|uniref:tRNA nucleotidyltransferase (CCA-adding enzyme) n=1 Tax=Sanguibacter antarcticus TaxID=372484 RepID=A0A2A9E3K2_9MICO|nr:HD domain-containing protein [Sanguibacter antarcticus]PFG33226.1 tRNA nucleotidyltransferase (CCA-adding enzyme) [Sanguibacter antarcticus]
MGGDRSQHGHPAEVRRQASVPTTAAAARVLGAITGAGGRGLLVGGCVRDALLAPGSTPHDIDIEVYGLEPRALVAALSRVAHVAEVGRAFSVLVVRTQGESFDVALPRRMVRTGSGPDDVDVVVDPSATLRESSARRDLTINALAFDPASGEVVDCWGGLADLDAGILRHTGPAFSADPLRVLRAARFAAQLGFTLDPSTVALARELAPQFAVVPTERVWGEWQAMAATAAHPSAWLDVLDETGWIEHFPEVAAQRGIAQDPRWHPEGDVFAHSRLAADAGARLADEAGLTGEDRAVVVLASMLHDVGKTVSTQHRADGRITSHGHDEAGRPIAHTFLSRTGAPRSVIERVLPLVREHMVATTVRDPSAAAVRRLARRLVPATMLEWALVTGADRGGRGTASGPASTGRWLELAELAGTTRTPTAAILTGRHLVEAGMTPGPHFATTLAAALAAQDTGVITSEEDALAWLAAR